MSETTAEERRQLREDHHPCHGGTNCGVCQATDVGERHCAECGFDSHPCVPLRILADLEAAEERAQKAEARVKELEAEVKKLEHGVGQVVVGYVV